MDIVSDIWQRHHRRRGLLGIEKIALIYGVFTALLALALYDRMDNALQVLLERAGLLAGLCVMLWVYRLRPCKLTILLRVSYQLLLLIYWYPDTYSFCRLLPYQDNVFASLDQSLFGCQPALLMSQAIKSKFWCEAFNLGYFSYYPLIILVTFYAFFACYRRFEKTTFIIVAGFIFYYLIFIFLPVAGPQYYYRAVGVDNIVNGVFPAVNGWFRTHTEMLPNCTKGGLFQWLVEATQASGERPTAAFPSSHVGMATILMILAFKMSRRLAVGMLPFYLLLCCATVYIQAHYAVDAIAGLATGVAFYFLCSWLYKQPFFHRSRGFTA